jgi:3-dehydroquinate dehydratase II
MHMTQPLILILNGPNLNMLGTREPEIYGTQSLADIESEMKVRAGELGVAIDFRQTNHEGELIEWVQKARETAKAIIINAGAFTHTSVALHDALKAIAPLPIVEVHLSNPHAREAFRHISYVAPAAKAIICGLGSKGYIFALDAAAAF